MIDDMTVRKLAPNTMLCYLKQVNYLARYFGRSPQQLGPEEITPSALQEGYRRSGVIKDAKPSRSCTSAISPAWKMA